MKLMDRMKQAAARFFYGRYGNDQLNTALCIVILVLYLAEIVLRSVPALNAVLGFLTTLLWLIVLVRMLSRNFSRRRDENARFLALSAPLRRKVKQLRLCQGDRTHKYFACKRCGTMCRVPRGRGKIIITCPKCGGEIHGKS